MMPRTLADRVADLDNLDRAWRELEANDAEDGVVAPAVAAFAARRFDALTELHHSLVNATFVPKPFTEVLIAKPDGDHRVLHLSQLVDRIVERAVAQVLGPLIDPSFSPWSFAYRPGLGVRDAAMRLVELRELGHSHVVRADIHDCFPSVSKTTALERLGAAVDDTALIELVRQLLHRPVYGRGDQSAPGLPQGSPLSPLLANLVLSEFDAELLDRGIPTVRYADDLAVAVRSEADGYRCRSELLEVARAMGFQLPHDGGEVMSFAEGFSFLGEEFTSSWPPVTDTEPVIREPEQRVLYVSHQGGLVRTSKGHLLVEVEDETVLEVPVGLVARVVLLGAVALSAGARAVLLDRETDVVLLSRRGRFQGMLTAASHHSGRLRRRQLQASSDTGSRCDIAKAFVAGKLANQCALLQRYAADTSREFAAARQQLTALRPMVAAADDIPVLLGVEGAAARAYFQAFGHLLPDEFRFEIRSRRPPLDPVNAALSYGYALLTGEAVSAAASAGLDPAVGFLHADDAGRPSFALDLMEEFRPLVVDTVVLSLFRRQRLTAQHFRSEDNRPGVLLTEEGRRRFLDAFEERMLTVFAHVPSGKRVSYRRALYLQALQWAAVIDERRETYQPVVWR